MPDLDWAVVSAPKHTAVLAPAEQLIFDPTYYAMSVTAQSALESVFGSDLTSTDYEVFEEEYAFSRHTVELIHIWSLIDGYPEADRLRVIQGMGGELENIRAEDAECVAA